jgi:hypothetical protein
MVLELIGLFYSYKDVSAIIAKIFSPFKLLIKCWSHIMNTRHILLSFDPNTFQHEQRTRRQIKGPSINCR